MYLNLACSNLISIQIECNLTKSIIFFNELIVIGNAWQCEAQIKYSLIWFDTMVPHA
jgi:hypothetical protein